MLKALLKLCLLVSIPVGYFAFANNPLGLLNAYFYEQIGTAIYGDSLKLIDQQLPRDANARDALKRIQVGFGSQLQLVALDDKHITPRQRKRLEKGEIVALFLDKTNTVAYKREKANQAIALSLEQTEALENAWMVRGPINLIKQQLAEVPAKQLQTAVTALPNTFHNLEFELLDAEAKTDYQQRNSLLTYPEFLVNAQGTRFLIGLNPENTLLIRTDKMLANTLQRVKTNFNIAIIVLTLLTVASVLLLWLYPLWRDHRKLSRIAAKFGEGHLDSRVAVSSRSFSAPLAESFNAMASKIQQLIAANQQITTAVAHDLRTPLARIRFLTEMLIDEDDTNHHESKQRLKESLESNIDTLEYLISQALQYSRYSKLDATQFTPCNFATVISKEVAEFSQQYPLLTFETDIAPELQNTQQLIDKHALQRALTNLLSNASKFARTKVLVSYVVTEKTACLYVEDDGPGIAANMLEKIFEPYVQLDEERNSAQGHGLGLAIVKQAAKLHKGDAQAELSELNGLRVGVCWPT